MNKKQNPDDVRSISHNVRVSKKENAVILAKAKEACLRPVEFLRKIALESIIVPIIQKSALIINEKLLAMLLEYRGNFKRLSNLIKAHDPSLNAEIEKLVRSMQNLIDKM